MATLFEKLGELHRDFENKEYGMADRVDACVEYADDVMALFDLAASQELVDLFKNLYNGASRP